MDTGTDSSDGEQELSVGTSVPVTMTPGAGLKPQMDNIFAEVEKSLPTIDFDLSDVSSDSEEPMIFHRYLKMSELDHDDEKDLDTSLSGESAVDFFKSPPAMIQIPSVDKNNASVSASPTMTFDNDLAALLSARGDHDEDDVSSWKDLERIARRDKQRQKEDSIRSTVNRDDNSQTDTHGNNNSGVSHSTMSQNIDSLSQPLGIIDAGNLVLAQLAENNASSNTIFGGRTADLDIIMSRAMASTTASGDGSSETLRSVNENKVSSGKQKNTSSISVSTRDLDGDVSDIDSNKEVERIMSSAQRHQEQQERKRREDREELRRKEKDLALSYMSAKAPHLNTGLLDTIDWDSELDNSTELSNWTPPVPVVRQLRQRSTASRPEVGSGEGQQGERQGAAESENLTLIQKLAKFSMKQSGKDYNAANIDPQTGASVHSPESATASTSSPEIIPTAAPGKREVKSCSAGVCTDGVSSSTVVGRASVKEERKEATSTDSAPSASMVALLETLNKRKPEPDTVFLDLRGFEQHQKEEKQHMASVSRVLGLDEQRSAAKEESSDSEDEGQWMEQRQKIKQSLTSRGTSTQPSRQRTQPARVINLQHKLPEKNTSSRGVTTASCGVSTAGDAGAGPQAARTRQRTGADSNRVQEEELAVQQAKEKEKEQQREAARLQREEREKIRAARLRMQQHLEGLRSTAAVSENKPCAENTPVLFDLEASYEPRSPVLPTSLDKEEVLLITVNMSSNGEIALHNSRSSKTSAETVINAVPKSYISLICWLVSLIPPDFNEVKQWLDLPEEGAYQYPEGFPPFHVIGLQQLLVDGNLCLAIAICPSPIYMLHKDDRRDRLLKKGKKGDDTSRFYKFVDTFISRSSLSSIFSWPRYLGSDIAEEEDPSEYDTPLSFSNSHLPFLGKPMSAYMQLHKEPGAVDQIFNKDVGFFWQTVDSQENVYQHGWQKVGDENVPQNTLFLLSKQALFRPQVVHETLFRVVSQSLDICGLRVLYPSSEKNTQPSNLNSSASGAVACPAPSTEGVTPVLAVAVRGPHARIRLVSIIGPMDYALARKTDPYSLTAIYGNARTGLQVFCPRSVDRANCELVRWFGGRAPQQGSADVGLPYRLKDQDFGYGAGAASGKGKKGKKAAGTDQSLEPKPSRPPAALTATTLSHVILVISPIVPIWDLGFLVSLMQQKAAFQPRGLRRMCLSVKKANSLGIPSAIHSIFCPGVNLDVADIDSSKQQQESCSPCTIVVLERENASHHAASLALILANELRSENVQEWMEDRTMTRFELMHLFHTLDYSDSLLTTVGGEFNKCPNFDPMCDMRGPMQPLYSNKEMEQVVVLILLGKDLIKDWGSFLQKLQTFSTTSSRLSDFELLGVKWLPGMNSFQTREVTPYEVGDSHWRTSVRYLANEPAVVFALRSVNAYKKLEPFITLPVNTSTTTIPPSTPHSRMSSRDAPHPTRIMSRTAKETYVFLRLFFWAHELYPDPDSRTLLPCLPESRLYYDTIPWDESSSMEESKPRIVLKSIEAQDLTQENIPEMLLCDGIPLTTFLLIKPRAVHKHLSKILRRILHEGFSVVGFRQDIMDQALARRFLSVEFDNAGQVHDLHLEYLTSEPCIYLALCRENGVKKLRDLLGPEDPQQARRQSQFYWRGIYGTDVIHNGLYASRTYIESVWDLKTFFPDGLCCDLTYYLDMEAIPCPAVDRVTDPHYNKTRHAVRSQAPCHDSTGQSHISDTEQKVHSLLMQTTCLVLPPALVITECNEKEAPFVDILNLLLSKGYGLVGSRMVWLTQQQAEQCLHILHSGSFEAVNHLRGGPSLVLALERDNAVLAFENTLGSTVEAQTILAQYGKDIYRPSDLKQAEQLLALFFDRLAPGSHMDIRPLSSASEPSPPASTASP